jgi:hypothetical protein
VYEGAMPVTYVYYTVAVGKDDVHDHSPSTAIVVVRKFLDEKLRDHPVVLFQMLGPSPCHVDVFIGEASVEASDDVTDLSLIGGGYRTFYFGSPEKLPEPQMDLFVQENHGVLSAFYMLVRLRNHAHRLREAVADGALGLLQAPERSGRWATFRHWRGYRERIDAVFEALLREKLNRVAQDRTEAEIQQDELVDSSNPFYVFIEREMGDPSKMPDEDIRELLVMLEERRRGYFETAATLVSGLVGGVLGATLGAFLTFGLASHSQQKAPQANAVLTTPASTPTPPAATLSPTVPSSAASVSASPASSPAQASPPPSATRPAPTTEPVRNNE